MAFETGVVAAPITGENRHSAEDALFWAKKRRKVVITPGLDSLRVEWSHLYLANVIDDHHALQGQPYFAASKKE